jgi:uncharacterized repeat protein (TIGR04076 family)
MKVMTVKVTVIDGKCSGDHHKVGQEFIVKGMTPAGMCLGAWDAIAPYVTTLRFGGNFPWEKEEGVAIVHCPDPQGITLELRRVE